MNTSTRAVISFLTDQGKVVSFSIPRARTDKSKDEAMASMDSIVASDALCSAMGVPVLAHGAKIITTTRTQIA